MPTHPFSIQGLARARTDWQNAIPWCSSAKLVSPRPGLLTADFCEEKKAAGVAPAVTCRPNCLWHGQNGGGHEALREKNQATSSNRCDCRAGKERCSGSSEGSPHRTVPLQYSAIFAIRAHYHYHHRKSDYWGGVPRSAQIGAIKGRAGRIGVSWAYDHKSTHHAGVHLIRTEFELGGYTKVGLVRSGRKW